MAAHIRLKRIGKIKRPYYRIVVVDSRAPRDGAYIDCLGHYQPIEADDKTKMDIQKYEEWLGKGAVPSNVVRNLAKRLKKA